MTRTWRLPIILVLIGVLVAGIAFEGSNSDTSTASVRTDSYMPTARSADAVGSTWYCAAGSATGDASGFAEQTVSIANSSDQTVTGRLTAYSDTGEQLSTQVKVGPHSRQNVRVSDVQRSRWASALVELSGGEVSVAQLFQGPAGRSTGACASAPAKDWYFPAGSSRNGARNLMAMFNPFPGDATVDLTFDTEDGARTPQQFQGLVLPGSRVTVVDIGNVVTLREHVSTIVHSRTGRVVAQQIQTADGREGSQEGLTVTLGASAVSPVWSFALATPPDSDAHEVIAVLNPSDADTTVEVQVQVDDADQVGSVEPYRITVAAGRSATLDLMSDARIPRSAGRWIIARSVDGTGVVVERSIGAKRVGEFGGLSYTMGVPIVATEWLATFGDPAWANTSSLAISNPAAVGDAVVTVTVHGVGAAKELSEAVELTIAAGSRILIDLSRVLANRNEASLSIESNQPVVVGQLIATKGPVDLMTPVVYPVSGTISVLREVVEPQVSLVSADELSTTDETVDAPSTTVSNSSTSVSTSSTSSTTASSSTTTTRR